MCECLCVCGCAFEYAERRTDGTRRTRGWFANVQIIYICVCVGTMKGTLLAELLLLGIAVGFQRGPHHPRAAVSGEPRIESHHDHHEHPMPRGDTKFTQDKPILHDKRSARTSRHRRVLYARRTYLRKLIRLPLHD